MMEIEGYTIKKGKELGADDIIAKSILSKERQIRFAKNSISISKEWASKEMEIFMAVDKKLIFTNIDEPTEEKIDRSIQKGIKMAEMMEKKEDYGGIYKGGGKYGKIVYDPEIINEEMIPIVRETMDAALSKTKEVAGVLYSFDEKIHLLSSEGIDSLDNRSGIYLSFRAFIDDASGHGVECSTSLKNFHPQKAGEEAGEIAKMASNPKEGKEGCYDVIFHPLAFANLVSCLASSSSAFAVDSGISFLINKLNEKVATNILTLVDDGLYGLNSRKFDDEGAPTGKNEIIKDGVLQTYLHNTSTAKKYGKKTTGNAGIVAPHPWNVVVSPGNKSKEKLLEENGIYITNVWYTRFQNYRTGDFSTIPRDGIFLMKNGKMESIKNIRISDNLPRIFENLEYLSRERRWIYWWETDVPSFLPYALVKDVKITRSR